jgi:GNAT superfamily N-acetyltransferase
MAFVAVDRRGPDLGPVVEALRAVHAHDGYPLAWPDDPVNWLTPPGTLGAWVATQDETIVGHALLVDGDKVEHAPQVVQAAGVPLSGIGGVSRLFVVPSARGTGAAGALLDHVEGDATRRGLRLALDVVDDGGPAVRFYERRGWVRVAAGPAGWVRPDGVRPRSAAYLRPSYAKHNI